MASKYFAAAFDIAYFRMGKWILGIFGFWPLDPLNRLTILTIFINLSVLLTAILGELRFAWLIRKNLLEVLSAICPCLTKLVTWIKLVFFVIYRKQLASLLNDLFKHLKSDTKDEVKNSMIAKVSVFTTVWWMVLLFFGISSNFLYVFKPIIIWGYQRYVGIKDSWVGLPFQAALPYEDMTQVNSKALYVFVYCFLAHSGNVTIFGFPGADGSFMSICMYLSVCYQCLQEDFKKAFKDHSERGLGGGGNSDLLYNDLCVLIKRQQNIIKIFNRFNYVYKFIIFGHFFFASIIMGIVLMNLQLTSGMTKMVNSTYVMGACTQLYTYCYGAEKVNANCLQIVETLYFCDWYRCDKRVKSLVLFVLQKTQRGSLMDVPFFSPSLLLFTSIIQTSGSYFTLLQTFL